MTGAGEQNFHLGFQHLPSHQLTPVFSGHWRDSSTETREEKRWLPTGSDERRTLSTGSGPGQARQAPLSLSSCVEGLLSPWAATDLSLLSLRQCRALIPESLKTGAPWWLMQQSNAVKRLARFKARLCISISRRGNSAEHDEHQRIMHNALGLESASRCFLSYRHIEKRQSKAQALVSDLSPSQSSGYGNRLASRGMTAVAW